jgi:hypothetical protein
MVYSVGSIQVCYKIGVLLVLVPQIYAVISPSDNEMCTVHSVDIHVHLMWLRAMSFVLNWLALISYCRNDHAHY